MKITLKVLVLSLTVMLPAVYAQSHFCKGEVTVNDGAQTVSVEAVISQGKVYYQGPLVGPVSASPAIFKTTKNPVDDSELFVIFPTVGAVQSSMTFVVKGSKTSVDFKYEIMSKGGEDKIYEGELGCTVFPTVNFKRLAFLHSYRFTYRYENTATPVPGQKPAREQLAAIQGITDQQWLPSAGNYNVVEFNSSLEVATQVAKIDGVKVYDRRTEKDVFGGYTLEFSIWR